MVYFGFTVGVFTVVDIMTANNWVYILLPTILWFPNWLVLQFDFALKERDDLLSMDQLCGSLLA